MATKAKARTWKRWAVTNRHREMVALCKRWVDARREIVYNNECWSQEAPHTAIPVLVTEILPKKRGKK